MKTTGRLLSGVGAVAVVATWVVWGCGGGGGKDDVAAQADGTEDQRAVDVPEVVDVSARDESAGDAGSDLGPVDVVDGRALDGVADAEVDDDLASDATEADSGPMGDRPFSAGPYGTAPFETAGPFVVPTLDGMWDFEAEWSGGLDSYLFLIYHPEYDYSKTLWESSLADLLKDSPENVHYFFMSYTETPESDMEELAVRFEAELAGKAYADKWKSRLHLVTAPPQTMVNWLGELVKTRGYFAFGIDRYQRLREAGLLMNVTGAGNGEMKYLKNEAIYYNYEFDRDTKVNSIQNPTEIVLFDKQAFANDAFTDIVFPSAEVMQGFDSMEIDLSLQCPDNLDDKCGEWDYLVNMYLCKADVPDDCNFEIGRWVTAYHRGGRWVTDESGLLALFQAGGQVRVRLNVSWQTYVVTAKFRLFNQGKGMRPVALVPLWTQGGEFNLSYNPAHLPIMVDIPAEHKRVEIFALITGHGFGSDLANCAEFCNHTHHFSVGGQTYKKEHLTVGVMQGCQMEVKNGVVPNQYGTWPFGRGGWCPGWDVEPWVADITSAVAGGGSQEISYKALYMNKEYDPKPAAEPTGFPGRIDLSSYLIIWN